MPTHAINRNYNDISVCDILEILRINHGRHSYKFLTILVEHLHFYFIVHWLFRVNDTSLSSNFDCSNSCSSVRQKFGGV